MEPTVGQPKKRVWLWVVLGGVGLVFVCCFGTAVLGVASAGAAGANRGVSASTPRQPSAPRQVQVQVDALKLWDDYHANEVAADEVYKGKVLQVSGKVHAITKDFTGSVVVELEARNPYMSSHARLDDTQAGTAAKLAKGQSVVLVCEGDGMVVGMPALSGCILAK